MITCCEESYYGVINLPLHLFMLLDKSMFISGTTDTTVYMCANEQEKKHLTSLCVNLDGVVCDWYKINLE